MVAFSFYYDFIVIITEKGKNVNAQSCFFGGADDLNGGGDKTDRRRVKRAAGEGVSIFEK